MHEISSIRYKNTRIDILRLDSLHAAINGNKFYKLKYNLEAAKRTKHASILTFGGAFSNHIYATAAAGKKENIKTIGVIRGQDDVQNPTLKFCRKQEMQLVFISRVDYAKKESVEYLNDLKMKFGNFYLIPEGGTNALAVQGCSEILAGIHEQYDVVFCAAGTGGTLAGLVSTPGIKAKVLGISVLKGEDTLTSKTQSLLTTENTNWEILFHYHFGGYAKYNTELLAFINRFQKNYEILLDPVYTGKVFYALSDMIDKDVFNPAQKILVIHSGGLQGWAGWKYRYKKK